MNQGTKVLVKNAFIVFFSFFCLPPAIGLAWGIFDKSVLAPSKIIDNFFGGHNAKEEWIIISLSFFVLILFMVLLGKFYKEQVEKRTRISINVITIFLACTILFFSSANLGEIVETLNNKAEEFNIDWAGWIAYGIGTYLLFALITFFLIGPWMGKEIKK